MYKLLLILVSAISMTNTTDVQSKQHLDMKNSDNKTLVAYFSATGTTAGMAKKLAAIIEGELYAITPAQTYTSADLNWNDKQSRSSLEMDDATARPAINDKKLNVDNYDIIFLGYPIWWDLAPRAINTFIETYNLKGKTVIPFATSGGSGIANSVCTLQKTYPDLNWKQGRLLNPTDETTLRKWIESL